MRVEVTRSGGFAGITRRGAIDYADFSITDSAPSDSLHTDTLHTDSTLSALIEAALADALKSQPRTPHRAAPPPLPTKDDSGAGVAASYSEEIHPPTTQRDRYQWNIMIGAEQFQFTDSELPSSVRTLALEVLKHPVTRPTTRSEPDH